MEERERGKSGTDSFGVGRFESGSVDLRSCIGMDYDEAGRGGWDFVDEGGGKRWNIVGLNWLRGYGFRISIYLMMEWDDGWTMEWDVGWTIG